MSSHLASSRMCFVDRPSSSHISLRLLFKFHVHSKLSPLSSMPTYPGEHSKLPYPSRSRPCRLRRRLIHAVCVAHPRAVCVCSCLCLCLCLCLCSCRVVCVVCDSRTSSRPLASLAFLDGITFRVPFVPFAAPLCSLFPRRVTCAPFENF